VACGCYQPHELPSGSPCSVAEPTCPEGQTCIRGSGGFSCQSSSVDAGIDGQFPAHRLSFPATVTACLAGTFPGETVCTDLYGPTSLVIASVDGTTMMPFDAYLRFDFDPTISGKTIAAVTLEMTAETTAQAASDHSGSVWQANPFTQASVASGIPGKTAMAVLAADRGAVAKGAAVDWSLAPSLVDATTPLCLELESGSVNNVIYDRNTPPILLVDVR
jgi:hypothetical protein